MERSWFVSREFGDGTGTRYSAGKASRATTDGR